MPFLRSVTLSAIVLATVLLGVAPATAQAESAQAESAQAEPAQAADARPASAATRSPGVDVGAFCPRPTGRWWEDVAARGCVERLDGRDHTTPVTLRELAWLDLGDLPAHATIDVDAIDATIAAHIQRIADEKAAAEQAAREAAAASKARTATRRPTHTRRTFSDAELIDISTSCGHDMGSAPTPEQDACIRAALDAAMEQPTAPGAPSTAGGADAGSDADAETESARYGACLATTPEPAASAPLGGAEWAGYLRSVAACVDAEIPGYLARWDAQQAEMDARLEEGRRNDAAARARLDARVEAAKAEAAATCPGAWTVSYFGWMVRSPDEVEVTFRCD